MDTGCIFPVTTTAIVEGMKAEIIPLIEELDIIDVAGKSLTVLGTCKMFIEKRILSSRKMVEAAVIQGDRRETLISLQLLKKWDLIHDSFPNQTISDHIVNKSNKKYAAYSMLYDLHIQVGSKKNSKEGYYEKLVKLF